MPPLKALSPRFSRAGQQPGERRSIDALSRWVCSEVDGQLAKWDPARLPFWALRRMDYDPVVYLAEAALTSLVRKPDLYHVTHPLGDRKLIAETEEWLWKLMRGGLLDVLARSFVYGAIPYVFDWGQGDLIVRMPPKPSKGGEPGKPRKRTVPNYIRITAAHELRPDQVQAIDGAAADELGGLVDLETGRVYDAGQSRVAIWDRQFGEWGGQGARRRAWRPWAKGQIFSLLLARFLERAVHVPLIIHAPGETVRPEGAEEDIPMGDFIAQQLEALMGGGSMTLPSDREDGEKKFEVSPLTLPDRAGTFETSIDRFDAEVFASYLVPPAMAVVLEEAAGGGASSRVLQHLFASFVEWVAQTIARELTGAVEAVHLMNEPDSSVPPCEVAPSELPAAVSKLYIDLLTRVGDSARLGERVDVNQMLDQLGVPRLPGAPEGGAAAPDAPPPGRPPERTGAREERREDARTEPGEEDTGAPRDEDGDPVEEPE